MVLRVLVADDHPIVRQGLLQIIAADRELAVVAEAGDGVEALAAITAHAPDVVVLDIDMPRKDGFAVVRAMREQGMNIPVVFLTMHRDETLFHSALALEARGYVLKDDAVTDIVKAIRAAAGGESFVSPSLAARATRRAEAARALRAEKPGLESLSRTERTVLRLIAAQKSTKEIAAELFVSPRTIDTHRANICRKLELSGSLALVKFALDHREGMRDEG
jgi:DNA-binding NarL/FixJ family response regulator